MAQKQDSIQGLNHDIHYLGLQIVRGRGTLRLLQSSQNTGVGVVKDDSPSVQVFWAAPGSRFGTLDLQHCNTASQPSELASQTKTAIIHVENALCCQPESDGRLAWSWLDSE